MRKISKIIPVFLGFVFSGCSLFIPTIEVTYTVNSFQTTGVTVQYEDESGEDITVGPVLTPWNKTLKIPSNQFLVSLKAEGTSGDESSWIETVITYGGKTKTERVEATAGGQILQTHTITTIK